MLYQLNFDVLSRLVVKRHAPIRLIFWLKVHGRAGCVAALVLGGDDGRSVRATDNAYCRRRFAAGRENPARFSGSERSFTDISSLGIFGEMS